MKTFCALLLSAILWSEVASMPFAPVVYRDDYVTINAGVVDASRRLSRVGEALTLHIAVHFDPDITRISELDDAFFERTFAKLPAVRLLETPESQRIGHADGMVTVENYWRFQILGCPDESSHCAGSREYALPFAILDYDVTRETDERRSQRSARLRPWPGSVTLVSAFPETMPDDASLGDWVPGGAMPLPASGENRISLALLPLMAGALLLLVGFSNRVAVEVTAIPGASRPMARWQQVSRSLSEEALSDAEWLDRYRRCLVWYLIDEEGINPYADSTKNENSDALVLLAEVIELVVVTDRSALLGRLNALIGMRRDRMAKV